MSEVTPNDMPGAEGTSETDVTDTAETTADTAADTQSGLTPEKLAELNRTLRGERKTAERRAKEAEQKAAEADQRWKQLASLFGTDGKPGDAEFDPQAEVSKLREDFNAERKARLLSEVARTEGVEPEDLRGDTEEELRDSARRFKERLDGLVEAALKAKNIPAAPPASTVTSDGKISGPQQITSHDELKKLSPTERMAAYRDGRLKQLMGESA